MGRTGSACRKRGPDVVRHGAVLGGLCLSGLYLFSGGRVVKNVEDAERVSLEPGMHHVVSLVTHAREWRILRCHPIDSGEHSAETRKQSHRVHLGQVARGFVPSSTKPWSILGRSEARLQFPGSVVIEAKVGSGESLLKDCHSSEQAHRPAFHLVGRDQQHFPIALKKCSRDLAQHIPCEGDGTVFQGDMNRGSIKRAVAHPKNSRAIESDTAQLQIEGFCWTGLASLQGGCLSTAGRRPGKYCQANS